MSNKAFWKFGLAALAAFLLVSVNPAVAGLSYQDAKTMETALQQEPQQPDTIFMIILDPDTPAHSP